MSYALQTWDLIDELDQVRSTGKGAEDLIKKCIAWLAGREAEEWRIRNERFRVSQKLDLLDMAADRATNVLRAARIEAHK